MRRQSEKPDKNIRVERLVRELRRINSEMNRILERLPLSNHQQVTQLIRLSEKQKSIVRTSPGTVPEAVKVFLDNEKHSARYIQMRYKNAMKEEKLRKPS